MATKLMRTTQISDNLHDAAGIHGSNIIGAVIGKGEILVIEVDTPESPHDGWGHIVGPNPPINADGTYLRYGKPAWIELAHLEDINADKTRITIEVNWSDKTIRIV